ncbi:cationic amino acid transporter 3-like isoform X2 [Convolutriloba macropyga]|uniref:cationic amino acid transporter 3-like isoform X2 n=1 Tax=Convolutriloba macropyga TaxID=536237 RepID=UPI003F522725
MSRSGLWSKLTRRRVLERDAMKTELNRCLSTLDLILIGIGNMVGGGMYVLTGELAAAITGPAVILSFFLAGVASGLSAWCYAEFGSQIPKAGSAYIYTYLTIGEFAAFVIGWNLILEHVIGAAAVVRGLLGYIDEISNNVLVDALPTLMQRNDFDPYTAIIIFALCVIVCLGVKNSVLVNNLLTFINLSVAAFVIFGAFYFCNWDNLTKPDGFFPYGVSSVSDGAAQAYFAFVGYDAIAISSEEAITPDFSIPFALWFVVIFVTCLYCAVSLSLDLLVPYDKVNTNAAFAAAFSNNGWQWAEYSVSIGAMTAMTCSLLGAVYTMPRCIYAMAQDGLIFRILAKIYPRTQVPVIATVLGCTGIAIFAFFLTLTQLAEFMSIGTLLAYLIIALAVIVLRYSSINLKESSETHLGSNVTRLSFEQIMTLAIFLILVAITNVLIVVLPDVMPDHLSWFYVELCVTFCVLTVLPLVHLSRISVENPYRSKFKVPFVPYLPGLSVFINFHLMTRLSIFTWARFVIWMAVGFVLYFWYGIRNSSLSRDNLSVVSHDGENEDLLYGTMHPGSGSTESSSLTSSLSSSQESNRKIT